MARSRGIVTNLTVLRRSEGVLGGAKARFSVEGEVQIGPRADYFLFLDGEEIGKVFSHHAGIGPKQGEYTRLGRARIIVEWLEDDEATEEASPT
jgi:hypothetical protein